uniref:Uncharacterized protein n=1 Tax=Chenopodium quinoa TaxID=63459 RepID=A0A803LKV8_CHEQI
MSHTTAQPDFMAHVCQDTFGNYTANSAFKKNLDTLFSTISSDTRIDYGFYNFSVGQHLDRVNGIGLCRPDVASADCRSCLDEGAHAIVQECPTQKDAIGWYDVFSVDKVKYNQTVSTLLAKLQAKAASGDSRRKFGAGKANVTGSITMYALVQCTPDLESFDCYDCLDNAIYTSLTKNSEKNARVVRTSCSIRYENYPFYDSKSLMSLDQPSAPPPKPPFLPPSNTITKKGKRSSKKVRVLIEILLPTTTFLLLVSALIVCYCLKRKPNAQKSVEYGNKVVRNPESFQMNFETIRAATGNFSNVNKLGQGGFGAVYKGRLPNGQAIAVKRLSKFSGQGEEEFKNEAVLVARLQHRNLVRFLGFCLEGEERLLIYEFLSNKSLDCFLSDPIKRVQLDWQTRFKIIRGVARGLLYLHEDSRLLVVHRDLKSGNILLDAEMNPKIADFGMARLFGVDQTRGDTSKICGTYGYMPPEYVHQGHFSFKSDVFSFGVLLLEIITGLRISSCHNSETGDTLLSFAWRNWLEGTPLNIADSSMTTDNTAEVLRCINIGLLCVQENIAHRPTMSSIVLMLNNNTIAPPVPSHPAFLLDKDEKFEQLNSTRRPKVLVHSANEVSISELDPR